MDVSPEKSSFAPEKRHAKIPDCSERPRTNEQKTQDKIKDLIPPGAINLSTKLVLTNAVYFKGKWEHPFKADAIHDTMRTAVDCPGCPPDDPNEVPA